jgi:hypothetical protein
MKPDSFTYTVTLFQIRGIVLKVDPDAGGEITSSEEL